jgi:hypothetical protein
MLSRFSKSDDPGPLSTQENCVLTRAAPPIAGAAQEFVRIVRTPRIALGRGCFLLTSNSKIVE